MILNRNLEINFIKNIQKKHSQLTMEEQIKMFERNNKVNSKFELNKINCNRLLLLNRKLFEKEKRIYSLYKDLENQCKKLIKSQLINDFEIEITGYTNCGIRKACRDTNNFEHLNKHFSNS